MACLLLTSSSVFASSEIKGKVLNSLKNFAKDHRIQATYEISVDGDVIVTGAQGYSDFEQNKRLSRAQLMPVLSLTKQLTSAAILLLQDRSLINVNDEISQYSKAFEGLWGAEPMPVWMRNITIHDLLTHSSGLIDYVGRIEVTKEIGRKGFEKSLGTLIKAYKKSFETGAKYSYNNTNYYLLGLIIEEISGKDLGIFMKSEFFDPIGMKSSYILSYEQAIDIQQCEASEIFPIRYFASPSETVPKFSPAPKVNLLAPGGDSGMVSTVHDLVKWNNALHSGKILSKTSYKKMIKPYFKVIDKRSGYNSQIGYGLYISKLNNGKIYYNHTTEGHGIRCDAGYIPEDAISLAIISNVNFIVPEGMASRVDFRKPENQIDIKYLRNAMLESL